MCQSFHLYYTEITTTDVKDIITRSNAISNDVMHASTVSLNSSEHDKKFEEIGSDKKKNGDKTVSSVPCLPVTPSPPPSRRPLPPPPPTYCPIHHPVSYLQHLQQHAHYYTTTHHTATTGRCSPSRPASPGPGAAYDTMDWPLPPGAHLLAPFDHQVAGQSSMLRYDESTVCKPLIPREHFVYQTLPECLKEFTADYRGELEVGLAEKDGYLQLYGLCVKDDSNEDLCQCVASEDSNILDVSKLGSGYPSSTINIASDIGDQSRCVIRVLRTGSYEMCSPPGENNASTTPPTPKPAGAETETGTVQTPSLNPWSLKNHKRLLDKMRKGKHRHTSFRCILLKNVVADFKHPCILDLKIGSRLHGDDAPAHKVENQTTKCAETTSSTLGVRLCGMQVFKTNTGTNINLDKYQGRLLTNETFRETLARFLHNGVRYRSELLQPIVSKLSNLINCLGTVNTYRFYASSLLIIYDGLEGDRRTTESIHSPPSHSSCNNNQAQKSSSTNNSSADQTQTQTIINGQHIDGVCTDVLREKRSGVVDSRFETQTQSVPSSAQQPGVNNTDAVCEKYTDQQHTAGDFKSNNKNNIVDFRSKSSLHTHSPSPQTHTDKADTASSYYSTSKPPPANNIPPLPVLNVDVKMIDFAHTTHRGFPNEPCRHEGPDMDYIQGLSNLKTLFETLLAEC